MIETHNGQDWATHTVSLLLNNTYALYEEHRALALRDPSGAVLGEFFRSWFWSPLLPYAGSDRQAIDATRDDLSRNQVNAIDWKSVAEDLIGE